MSPAGDEEISSPLFAIYVSPLQVFTLFISPKYVCPDLKARLSLSLSVCISFDQAPEPTCDVEKFMGGPNAPASHAFIKDRLISSRVVHSHDARNNSSLRIFHKDFYTLVPACFNQVSTLCLQVGLLFHTSYGFRHISTSYPSPGPSPVWIYLVTSKNLMPHDVILQFLHYS